MLIPIGRRAATDDLVDLLLECHHRIRGFVALARSVAAADDLPAAEVVDACASCARYFREALPLHVRDEEDSLVPRMRGLEPALDDALRAMTAEHLEHQPQLGALLAALESVRIAPSDLARRAALGATAAALAASFEPHLLGEEQVIFPAIRRLLPSDAQAKVVAELRVRRLGSLGA